MESVEKAAVEKGWAADAKILDVGIVVVVSDSGETFTRTACLST
jgi:hypothetical protein